MTKSLLALLSRTSWQSYFNQRTHFYGLLITIIFLLVISMEYTTPSAYVFGYLYTGAILLANYRLGRKTVVFVTLAAAGLTLLNLLFPILKIHNSPTVANRIIAVIALLVTGWLSIRLRIYEEKIAYQQAQIQAQQQLASIREDFISTLTHDLKTPLLGAIETLKSFQGGHFGRVTPSQNKILEMMHRSHRSTLQLVETMLDIYRNDVEGLRLQLEPINLTILLEEIVTTLTDLAQSRRIHLHIYHHQPDTRQELWSYGDRLQLGRVLTNLLSNAINHSPRGSGVEIILTSKGNQPQVSFCDRGQGIVPEELPHLFERFYQGLGDRQAKGSGLGLYLSRQIIEAHGGTIWAENRPAQGAIFSCRLPALTSHEI